jgi:hypothetical protein
MGEKKVRKGIVRKSAVEIVVVYKNCDELMTVRAFVLVK